jgi:multidrug efflux system membrane fusion protein
MKPFWKVLLIVCIVAGGGGYYWWYTQAGTKTAAAAAGKAAKGEGKTEGKGAGKRGSGGPLAVTTVTVAAQPMPVVIDGVGTVESENSVAVRPQISGVLEAVLFNEGDRVNKGQPLFRIDPRPLQTAVEQTTAALSRDKAQLAQAKAQEARLRPLMEKDYITRSEYDVAETLVKSLESTVAVNQAVLDQSKLQLSYAHIDAPISGRTGSLSVKAGNLVAAGGSSAPLIVINSTQPVQVSLAVPQRYLEDVRRYWKTPDLKVELSPNPGGDKVAEGELVFIDNTVNPTTGTITLKARVKNEHEQLWPGQFVAARIILRVEKEALVLPEKAVQPGQDTSFVYLVRDGKAVMRPVKIARQVGTQVVIAEGIAAGDQVVVNVPFALVDGSPVVVQGAAGTAAANKGKPDDDAGKINKDVKPKTPKSD